jgi:translation initiation factor IF-3
MEPHPNPRRNHRIRAPEVQVISQNGEQLGVMLTSDAVARALDAGLDLVEVAPQTDPPICRIMDFGGRFRNRRHFPPDQWGTGAN